MVWQSDCVTCNMLGLLEVVKRGNQASCVVGIGAFDGGDEVPGSIACDRADAIHCLESRIWEREGSLSYHVNARRHCGEASGLRLSSSVRHVRVTKKRMTVDYSSQ